MINSNAATMIQPRGYNFLLTDKHCSELAELKECIFSLSSTLNREYENICSNYSQEINGFLEKGLSQGNFRDALTMLTGKPYLNWEFSGSRSRYWRMLTAHTYQQFFSRYHRSKLIELVEEWDIKDPSSELWDEIIKRKIKTNSHQLDNVLKWKKSNKEKNTVIAPVPIDYSATDSSMISQEIVSGIVHVTLTCVRNKKFTLSYPIPPHIVGKYRVGKVSKPAFTIDDEGNVNVKFTVYTKAQKCHGQNILGVDLGKVKPFSASSITPHGYYSQELIYSKELEHISKKINRLLDHKKSIYSKKMRLYSLLISPYKPDELAVDSYRALSEEYSNLQSCVTKLKEHAGWLIARDVASHALNSHCGIIHIEDLSWLSSRGGKWDHSSTQAKIDHVACGSGIKVHKVDAYGTSWEFPEKYDINPAPRSTLNTSARELTSPTSGRKMDKDRSASVAIACRPKKKNGKNNTASNRKRIIQPVRCRDKHHATPKRPKLSKKKAVVINKTNPQYVSVIVDTAVEDKSTSQAVKNTENTTAADYPLMSHSP